MTSIPSSGMLSIFETERVVVVGEADPAAHLRIPRGANRPSVRQNTVFFTPPNPDSGLGERQPDIAISQEDHFGGEMGHSKLRTRVNRYAALELIA